MRTLAADLYGLKGNSDTATLTLVLTFKLQQSGDRMLNLIHDKENKVNCIFFGDRQTETNRKREIGGERE